MKKYGRKITFAVDDKLAAELERRARLAGMSLSEYVRELVGQKLRPDDGDALLDALNLLARQNGQVGQVIERQMQELKQRLAALERLVEAFRVEMGADLVEIADVLDGRNGNEV